MIRVNLLPSVEAVEKVPIQVQAAVAVVVLGILGLGGWYWSLSSQKAELEQVRQARQARVAELQTILDEIEEFKKEKASLERRIGIIENLRDNQKGPVELMNVIIASIPDNPPGLWLANLAQRGPGITIEGRAFDVPFIADFIAALNNSPFFRFVELQFWEQDQPNSIRFQLNCQTQVENQ